MSLWILCAALLACAGCGGRKSGTNGARTGATPATSVPSARSAFQHIFLVVLENQSYSAVIGSPNAPYLNLLAGRYGLATSYYAVAHPSLPNYLAMLSGETFGLQDDCEDCFQQAPNLADQLQASGRTWKAYMEDLPAPCSLVPEVQNYALKHDPFLYFQSIRNDQRSCRQVVPLTALDQDLSHGSVPSFAWISPNLIHDGHDSDLATTDAWLRSFVPRILNSPAWQEGGLLIITFDEGENDAGCCGAAGGGQVATLAIAPNMRPGVRTDRPANHYGLLRALEDGWGLPPLGHAATADGRWLSDLVTS